MSSVAQTSGGGADQALPKTSNHCNKMNPHVDLALIFALACSGDALADSGEQLSKAKGCMVFHSIDTGQLGPSFRDISHRFNGLSDAKLMLTHIIMQTGTDVGVGATTCHWGAPMPPGVSRVPVNQAEADQLVESALSLH
jgi:cytochrome c551/c552